TRSVTPDRSGLPCAACVLAYAGNATRTTVKTTLHAATTGKRHRDRRPAAGWCTDLLLGEDPTDLACLRRSSGECDGSLEPQGPSEPASAEGNVKGMQGATFRVRNVLPQEPISVFRSLD